MLPVHQALLQHPRTEAPLLDTGAAMASVHQDLVDWLPTHPQLLARVGGRRMLEARVEVDPDIVGFDFDYYNDRFLLGPDLLLGWTRLRQRTSPGVFAECTRLFLLHEGHHIGQGMAYTSRDIGRAGYALEAVDYDADVVSIEGCLRWRCDHDPDGVRQAGQMGTLADILDTVLCGLRTFDDLDPGAQLHYLKERRLRRYLIWHFQRARARAAPRELLAERLRLCERAVLETPGVPTTRVQRGGHTVQLVQLDRLARASRLELVIYWGGRLYRKDPDFCRDILEALRQGLGAGAVSRVFNRLFEEHPGLVPT